MTGIDLLGNGAGLGPSSLVGAFIAGLIVALGPGSLGLVPVITGYVLGAGPRQGWVRLVAFLAGIVVAGMILGAVFAAAGWLVGVVIGPAWHGLIGVMLIVMGLRLLRLLRFKGIALRAERRHVSNPVAAFFFGMPFVFAL